MGATRFGVGDRVEVLNSCRLPRVKEVRHVGVVERITERDGLPVLYWISGLAVARTHEVLRPVVDDEHLLVRGPRRTLTEQWAAEDEERRAEHEW